MPRIVNQSDTVQLIADGSEEYSESAIEQLPQFSETQPLKSLQLIGFLFSQKSFTQFLYYAKEQRQFYQVDINACQLRFELDEFQAMGIITAMTFTHHIESAILPERVLAILKQLPHEQEDLLNLQLQPIIFASSSAAIRAYQIAKKTIECKNASLIECHTAVSLLHSKKNALLPVQLNPLMQQCQTLLNEKMNCFHSKIQQVRQHATQLLLIDDPHEQLRSSDDIQRKCLKLNNQLSQCHQHCESIVDPMLDELLLIKALCYELTGDRSTALDLYHPSRYQHPRQQRAAYRACIGLFAATETIPLPERCRQLIEFQEHYAQNQWDDSFTNSLLKSCRLHLSNS